MSDQERDITAPDAKTRAAEDDEARAGHQADRPPTAEEDQAAPGREVVSEDTEKGYKEMSERGANVKGEGQIP